MQIALNILFLLNNIQTSIPSRKEGKRLNTIIKLYVKGGLKRL